MRMKILSLELLDGLLKTAGPVFKSSERCIFAVKQYLCMSLVQVIILQPLLLTLTLAVDRTQSLQCQRSSN